MKKVVELAIRHALKDRSIDFAPISAALSHSNAKVLGITAAASSAGKMMNIRLLVENPAAAVTSLKAAKIDVVKKEALSFKVGNRPNGLVQVTAALGQANTKIVAMTAAASSAGRMLNISMLVENPASAMDALKAPPIA